MTRFTVKSGELSSELLDQLLRDTMSLSFTAIDWINCPLSYDTVVKREKEIVEHEKSQSFAFSNPNLLFS